MSKGYPRTRFIIDNQSQINQIEVITPTDPIPVAIQTYTSDKGSEKWELLTSYDEFAKSKGGINFTRHGQAQLNVLEILRNGSYCLAKRLVSSDAELANVTLYARVNKVEVADDNSNISYVTNVYFYAQSIADYQSIDDIAEKVQEDYEAVSNNTDIPLFTITPLGRGVSNMYFRIIPSYRTSRHTSFVKYDIQVIENNEVLNTIMFSINPDAMLDGVNQSIDNKVNTSSDQIQVRLYEQNVFTFASALAETATLKGEALTMQEILACDIFNGIAKDGVTNLGGITINFSDNATPFPNDIANKIAYLTSETGVALAGLDANGDRVTGSYGAIGYSPMSNPVEYEKLLNGAWGGDQTSEQFDPIIYDTDNYKIHVCFDSNLPVSIKNRIIDLADVRQDFIFLADLGLIGLNDEDGIADAAVNITKSYNVAIYHNYQYIPNPYTNKKIKVTIPYLLIPTMIAHINKNATNPFAGIANGITFPQLDRKDINFIPINIPGNDKKQTLVNANVNYISFYDGMAVMDTMYTNDSEYSDLSFVHNVMFIQMLIRKIRSKCPTRRYTFLDGEDLQAYIDDTNEVLRPYKPLANTLEMVYLADEKYETSKIFYAALRIRFRNFIQEELFRVTVLGSETSTDSSIGE